MKKIILYLTLLSSCSVFSETSNFLECTFGGSTFDFISASVHKNTGKCSKVKVIEIKVEHSNEKVTIFYPKISNEDFAIAMKSKSITLIGRNATTALKTHDLKYLFLDIEGSTGSLHGILEGREDKLLALLNKEQIIEEEVINYKNAFHCNWISQQIDEQKKDCETKNDPVKSNKQ